MAVLQPGGPVVYPDADKDLKAAALEPVLASFDRTRPVEAGTAEGEAVRVPVMGLSTPTGVNREEPGLLKGTFDTIQAADKQFTANVAETFNVTPKTVNTVGLISLIGTGAGLLANGVKSLFDGTLKAKRAEKKAAKQQAKQLAAAKAQAELQAVTASLGGQGKPAGGGVAQPGSGFMAQAGPFLQKNWWIVAIAAFLLLGGSKMFKPKRRAPRRRAAPVKTVYRYRTRKPAARRRR